MADERLRLLRGRVSDVDTYESPQRGGSPPNLPSLDPAAHRAKLLQQIGNIQQEIAARPDTARDELATREIVAVRPILGAELAPEQLDDSRSDARLVGVDPDTGVVLLDVANAKLDHLQAKVTDFGDDTQIKTKTKDGTITIHRASERAVAPVDSI